MNKKMPNKEQIEKESNEAAVLRNGTYVVGGLGIGIAAIKKYGPKLLKAIKAIKKWLGTMLTKIDISEKYANELQRIETAN